MKKTFSKLRSERGSSMIIAIVFMMICVFFGGAVLTAASVNGGRIAGKYEQQQSILNQRSIISVFAATLSDEKGKINQTASFGTDSDGNRCIIGYDGETGIKKAIFKAADTVCRSNADASLDFTVTVPDGGRIECYLICAADTYKTTIGFKEDPQLVLEMYARVSSSTVKWYGGKIVKAGAAE